MDQRAFQKYDLRREERKAKQIVVFLGTRVGALFLDAWSADLFSPAFLMFRCACGSGKSMSGEVRRKSAFLLDG